MLNSGVNGSWNLGSADRSEGALLNRIVMPPHAARRVRDRMVRLIDAQETRHGKPEP